MKIKKYTLVIVLALFATSCYMPISGRVIDADTKQPVEGAVVLVEWTKTIGIGLTRTESYKVAETLSDKEGRFDLPGCYSSFVNEPNVTIYKKGYIAWSSRWLFPSMHNRTDYRWGDSIFRLERFQAGYSYIAHIDFITSSINSSINLQAKKKIYDAFRWEGQMASEERDKKASERK